MSPFNPFCHETHELKYKSYSLFLILLLLEFLMSFEFLNQAKVILVGDEDCRTTQRSWNWEPSRGVRSLIGTIEGPETKRYVFTSLSRIV